MPENSGRYRSRHGVSRQTIVMRKAKDEDARRIAERDAADALGGGGDAAAAPEASGPAASSVTRLIERGTIVRTKASSRTTVGGGRKDLTQSGRQVVVSQAGGISGRLASTRLTVDKTASIRVAGGDTIIHYKSGDMVIRRGARRAELRKQAIVFYAAGYILLFGLYAYFLFTGTTAIEPREFVDKAFSRRESTDILDLERAAYEVMRGNRTPAEMHMAQALSFYDENKDPVHVEAGNRLTLLTAAKLARAIIEDGEKPESLRSFAKPFKIYKETYLAGINWPICLSLYNSFGFFLLLALFLWRPLMHYLGTQGKKTAVALRNSRDALDEASAYREKYRGLSVEVMNRAEDLRARTEKRLRRDREEALEDARRRAEEISGGVEAALANEEKELAGRITSQAARQACDKALDLLRERMGQKEHDRAIEELIADIAGMRLSEDQGAI